MHIKLVEVYTLETLKVKFYYILTSDNLFYQMHKRRALFSRKNICPSTYAKCLEISEGIVQRKLNTATRRDFSEEVVSVVCEIRGDGKRGGGRRGGRGRKQERGKEGASGVNGERENSSISAITATVCRAVTAEEWTK